MKKEWKNPELFNEELAITNEALECEIENELVKCIFPHEHVCPKCNKDFGHGIGSHNLWVLHVLTCNTDEDTLPSLPEVTLS